MCKQPSFVLGLHSSARNSYLLKLLPFCNMQVPGHLAALDLYMVYVLLLPGVLLFETE